MNKTESKFVILLVEDNKHDRIAFTRAFKESGISHEIIVCTKAEEALKRIQEDESTLDIVVIDHGLPGMSGLELCEELLSRKVNLPLVLITGEGTTQIAVNTPAL